MPVVEVSVETVVEVDIEVWCMRCGAGLCHVSKARGQGVSVEPCKRCMGAELAKGMDEGYGDGVLDTEKRMEGINDG